MQQMKAPPQELSWLVCHITAGSTFSPSGCLQAKPGKGPHWSSGWLPLPTKPSLATQMSSQTLH